MGDVLDFPERPAPDAGERLWREVVGEQLRTERLARGQRLVDVAGRAGVSVQYLSEVERGLKDPSSEMLGAISQAVDLTLAELSRRVATSTVSGALCLAA